METQMNLGLKLVPSYFLCLFFYVNTQCYDLICVTGGVAAGFIYANLEYWLPGKKPAEVKWNEYSYWWRCWISVANCVLQNYVVPSSHLNYWYLEPSVTQSSSRKERTLVNRSSSCHSHLQSSLQQGSSSINFTELKWFIRSIVNPDDKTGLKITLFQYQTCPFCCKVCLMPLYYEQQFKQIIFCAH